MKYKKILTGKKNDLIFIIKLKKTPFLSISVYLENLSKKQKNHFY